MKRAARNEELHLVSLAQVRPDDVVLRRAVLQHHQHLDRIAEIVMIELVVADAVQLHRLLRRQHEIERRARPPAANGAAMPPGAIWCLLMKVTRT